MDAETNTPLEGALILLLDEAGAERGGYLTNDAGRFLLRAPGVGTYTLRAERIGYATTESEPFHVSPGQRFDIELRTAPAAIELEELVVEGEQQCVVRPQEGLEVARVWEEARKALTVQEWTEGEGLFRFRLVNYDRELDPQTRAIRSETLQGMETVTRSPIHSLPVEDLHEEGYIRPDGRGGYMYYGPDATVLLSDLFLDTHCFRLTTRAGEPDVIGLSFEPVHRRNVPDIDGTLWLDRATGKLRYLEYGYDWAPWAEAMNVAGGRVEFEELPNGAWIIRKWWIRMPEMGQTMGGIRDGRSGLRVIGIREAGGQVSQISSLNRQAISEERRGSVSGRVWDSIQGAPLSGATVFLSGTAYATATDSSGVFDLVDVREGDYLVAFSHPDLDARGIFVPGVPVHISPDDAAEVILAVPSRETVMGAVCPASEREDGDAAVTGTVRWVDSGLPVQAAQVTVEWKEYSVPGGRNIKVDVRGLQVSTDERGRFRVCGIPPGTLATVRAAFQDRKSVSREVEAPRNGIVALNLTLGGGSLNP